MVESKKFLCKKEIANLYNISRWTLVRILKQHKNEIGEPFGYLFSPIQIEKIKNILGGFENDFK